MWIQTVFKSSKISQHWCIKLSQYFQIDLDADEDMYFLNGGKKNLMKYVANIPMYRTTLITYQRWVEALSESCPCSCQHHIVFIIFLFLWKNLRIMWILYVPTSCLMPPLYKTTRQEMCKYCSPGKNMHFLVQDLHFTMSECDLLPAGGWLIEVTYLLEFSPKDSCSLSCY